MTASPSDTVLRHMAAQRAASSGTKSEDEPPMVTPNLLVPLAKHSKAKAGLEFISHFFTNKEAIRLTLLHIPPSQAAVWAEETSYESIDLLETQAITADKKGRVVVEHAKRQLQAAGFPGENIESKIDPPQMSKARDILREARNGMYDAVVLGRRVQEGLADVMDQSVCREFLEGLSDSISFPFGCVDCQSGTGKTSCCALMARTRRIA